MPTCNMMTTIIPVVTGWAVSGWRSRQTFELYAEFRMWESLWSLAESQPYHQRSFRKKNTSVVILQAAPRAILLTRRNRYRGGVHPQWWCQSPVDYLSVFTKLVFLFVFLFILLFWSCIRFSCQLQGDNVKHERVPDEMENT